jgi:hypothetical protein
MHLRLDLWRPCALIHDDDEVAGEVVHVFAVSSMRRRKKTRLSPANRYGGSSFGLGLGRVGLCWAGAARLLVGYSTAGESR